MLEKTPSDTALIQEVFRAMHTLKGGAATLGLEDAVAVCHGMETVLDEVRSCQRSITSEMMDGLFQVLDWLRDWRSALGEGTKAPDSARILSVVRTVQGTADYSADPDSPKPPEAPPGKAKTQDLTAILEATAFRRPITLTVRSDRRASTLSPVLFNADQ